VQFDPSYFWGLLFSTTFLMPALTTVLVTFISMIIAMFIGLIVGIGLLSRSWMLVSLCKLYVGFFRSIPVLVQIVFWYNGVSALSGNAINLPALVAGVVALSIYESAYMAEITRAALISVDIGQREAALSLGLTYREATRKIIIPQAIRIAVPPTGNEFIKMLKTTSILFVIAVPEIFAAATQIYATNFRYFEVLAVISIYYIILTYLFTSIQNPIERYFSRFGGQR
jgi:His/Glu/Gln/Arg/opine family amino acid ABC transporter permease subunit